MKNIRLWVNTLAFAAVVSLGTSSRQAHAQTFQGSSSGTWGTPDPGTNVNPVFSGVDTSVFTWGNPANFGVGANKLTFTGSSFSTGVGSLFEVGNLTYFNGITTADSLVNAVPLNVALLFSNPDIPNKSFEFDFRIVTTLNTGNPEQNADSVFPINSFSDESFTFNGTPYRLSLTGFSQNGEATIVEKIRVLEGQSTTATVLGRITPVPEPEAVAALPLMALFYFVTRQKKLKKQKSSSL